MGIWDISQIPTEILVWYIFKIWHLVNSTNTKTFQEFTKCLGFWETPQISRFPKPLKYTQILIRIWEIFQIPCYL